MTVTRLVPFEPVGVTSSTVALVLARSSSVLGP